MGVGYEAPSTDRVAKAGDSMTGTLTLEAVEALAVGLGQVHFIRIAGGRVYVAFDGTRMILGSTTRPLRIDSNAFAVNGNAPTPKAAAIASPTADVASLKVAVDALRAIAANNGFSA